jgi:unsaturated chondroitin disaccharide hydrolase
MKRLIFLLLLKVFLNQSAYCQGLQIQHIDFLVENRLDTEFKGIVWINAQDVYSLIPGFDGFSFVVTTTNSPDLESDLKKIKADELESQPVDENGDGKIERIGVYTSLKPLERKLITLQIGEINRIMRIKGQYKNLCDALKLDNDLFWESDKIGYRYDNSTNSISIIGKMTQRNILQQVTAPWYDRKKVSLLGEEITVNPKVLGFGGLGILKNTGISALGRSGNSKIIANGPLVSGVKLSSGANESAAVEIHYTLARGSRWTIVDIALSGNWKGNQFVTGIPIRSGEKVLTGKNYIGTFAGAPALGLGLYVPEDYFAGSEKNSNFHLLKLKADKNGNLRYAISGYWELEHDQNIVYPDETDARVPEVIYGKSDKRLNLVNIRPNLKINTIGNFEKALNNDINTQFTKISSVKRISERALTYTELYPPEAVKENKKKSYKESLDLMVKRVGILAEKGLNAEGNERFWEQSNPQGNPSYLKPNNGWGNGYWVSMLWDAYKRSGDLKFKEWALKSNRLMLGSEEKPSMVAGLDYWDASVRSYQETGDRIWRESALRCAENMYKATMNSKAGIMPESFIKDGKDKESPYKDLIYCKVDAMICIPILFWAYQETKDKKYFDAGKLHAMKTKENLIEPDGVAFQLSWHNAETGELIGLGTNQGLGGNSNWARGQAWVLDGFADAFIMSKDKEFADIFRQSAQWLMDNLPRDFVSWYDYDDQGVFYRYRDTSASAVSAYALLRMSDVEPDQEEAKKYRIFGIKIINSLIDNYLTKVGEDDARPEGMLSHQCYVKHFNSTGEQIWGSFNLMRALTWLQGKGIER